MRQPVVLLFVCAFACPAFPAHAGPLSSGQPQKTDTGTQSQTSVEYAVEELPDAPAAGLTGSTAAQGKTDTSMPGVPTATTGPLNSPGQSATKPAQQEGDQPQNPTAPEERKAQADRELKQQEKQRILGVMPNFNTVISGEAVPLTPGQKFQLTSRGIVDPFVFAICAINAGVSQAQDDDADYGQGAAGFFKRFGATYADNADGALWGGAILPVLLKEDPRYFRRGKGSIKRRLFYAISTTVITKNDNGTWGPNYANVLGNLIAGGISNLYYPANDRGVGSTFERAFIVTAEGAIGATFVEFWPDISQKLFKKHPPETGDAAPAASSAWAPATPAAPAPSATPQASAASTDRKP